MKISNKLLLLFALSFVFSSSKAQQEKYVFIHKEVQKAIDNKTRSNNGTVGESYWQNFCNYDIKAEIFPEEKLIKGVETLSYFNNSPDTLKRLYFSNIQDLFKKGVQRDWDMGKVDLHDGVKINSIIIDGNEIKLDLEDRKVFHKSTDMIVILDNYFEPNSEHEIIISWINIIPKYITIRNGVYNETNYMLGYWFPKMKVYDDVYAWAKIPHTGMAEFYHEFGNYNVEITTPEDYKLWSTGLLQNASDIYKKHIIKRLEKSYKSDKVINIITAKDNKDNNVLKNKGKNTWVLKMDTVPDFAFAISKDFIWDATSVDILGNRVMVNAVYKVNSKDFHQVADITRNIIDYFSNTNPGIAYPYPQMTAFNGGGGMEYPAMVNDGDNDNLEGTLYLTAHEVGHTYFPFNTGLNEQRYAWMDEGLITYFPRKFVRDYLKDSSYILHQSLISSYNRMAATDLEIPLMVPSYNTGTAYRYHAYNKSSVAYYELCSYLGEDVFNKTLQQFAFEWEHKHPSAYDFFNTFNSVSGENLSWFFNPWFFEMKNADLAVGELTNNKLQILNKGGLPVAIRLKIYDGNKEKQLHFKANVWKGSNVYEVEIPEGFKLKKAELSTLDTPDINLDDNIKEF